MALRVADELPRGGFVRLELLAQVLEPARQILLLQLVMLISLAISVGVKPWRVVYGNILEGILTSVTLMVVALLYQ